MNDVNLKKTFLMKRTVLSILILLSLGITVSGQRSESEIALREYFIDAEFFLAQEFYVDALSDYLQVYKRGYQDNPNINYRIGICYLYIPGQKDKAIKYLEKAKQSVSTAYRESTLNEKFAPLDVYLYLGNAYRVNNMLDKAVESYMKYKEILPEEEVNLHKYADQQIEACNIASEFMSSPVDLEIINLGEVINSSNDDYKAIISGDGSTLVYMHKLPFYDAVYYSTKQDGKWSKPDNITPELLSDGNQFVCGLSYDGKTLLLSNEDEFNSDIMMSLYDDEENRWTEALLLGANVNTKYWESHASLSRDGKTIYFASNRRNGKGEMDLYMAELNDDGEFGQAQNIEALNTELNEDTPFITPDGEMLFFASQGFTSMGGYDIFVSKREGSSWGLPQNLGYPVNSTDDDLFYYPIENGEAGLMSLITEDGFGGNDINEIHYKALPLVLQKSVKEPAIEQAEEIEKIIEEGGEEIAEVEEELAQIETVTEEAIEEVEAVEELTETIPEETEVAVEVKQVEITPVFFGFDKSLLSAEGKDELDMLAALLKENSGLTVVLIGFTDPLGPESYNLTLSKKRAQSALSYLKTKGVDASRIRAIGKGETNFIAKNTDAQGKDLPEGRKFNRRVEFEIKGTDLANIKLILINPVPDNLKAD